MPPERPGIFDVSFIPVYSTSPECLEKGSAKKNGPAAYGRAKREQWQIKERYQLVEFAEIGKRPERNRGCYLVPADDWVLRLQRG